MGPIKLIHDLPENFLVMNGDILTDLNFRDFAAYHVAEKNIFTISSYRRDERVDYGVLEVDDNRMLCGFKEKPSISYHVSMGIYMVNRRVLDFIPSNTFYGFDDLMRDLIAVDSPAGVRVHEGSWLDIGRPDDYAIAIERVETMRGVFLP
jgi:NDP-sugar pyrophosphorylase family protein